tara:strand:- start:286 stop:477 length:192 start_codon:yes stop_codon:yes gene_type:complete
MDLCRTITVLTVFVTFCGDVALRTPALLYGPQGNLDVLRRGRAPSGLFDFRVIIIYVILSLIY